MKKLTNDFSVHQVVIIQCGKMAFSTKELTLEQWLWCLFFGLGTLLWGQLVTTVPTRKIPKILSYVFFILSRFQGIRSVSANHERRLCLQMGTWPS